MKKTILILLILALCCSLAACGESPELSAARQQIDGLGEVTLDSGEAILAAEKAVEALTPEERAKLENAETLAEARAAYDALVEEAERAAAEAARAAEQARVGRALCGEWVQVGGPYQDLRFSLKDDGSVDRALPEPGSGSWALSADSKTAILSFDGAGTAFTVAETDAGFTLSCGDAVFCSLDRMDPGLGQTIRVRIDPDNITEYLGEPVCLGKLYDTRMFIWEYSVLGYQFPSVLYDLGYVYLGSSEDFDFSYLSADAYDVTNEEHTYSGPFSLLEIYADSDEQPLFWPLREFPAAAGELIFVRSEYVEALVIEPQSNSMYEEDRADGTIQDGTEYGFSILRTVRLRSGESFSDEFFGYFASEPLFDETAATELYDKAPY